MTSDEVARLHHLTEGWPAGAQLAVLALQRSNNREHFFEAFAATDRAIGDFLITEVLDGLPADLVQFLVDTSVLEQFDAGLCATVGETERAPEYLDRLIAADLFVVLLDERAGWFRYHHLFGAFLRARLANLGEVRRRAVHDRACRALTERGEITTALRHAMATNDVDRAGQILRATFDRHLTVPPDIDVIAPAVRAWLHEFGASLVSTDPKWILEFLIALIAIAGPDDAEWWLKRVEGAHPAADGVLATLIEGAWAELHLYRGQSSAGVRHARAALDAVGGEPPAHGLASLAFSIGVRAHLQAGELDEARALLRRAAARPAGNVLVDEVRHPGFAAWIAALDGDLGHAEALAESVRRAARRLELGEHEPGLICAGLARVEILLERNELAAATDVIEHVRAAGDASQRPSFRSAVALQQAKLARGSVSRRRPSPSSRRLKCCSRTPMIQPDRCSQRKQLTRRCGSIHTVQQPWSPASIKTAPRRSCCAPGWRSWTTTTEKVAGILDVLPQVLTRRNVSRAMCSGRWRYSIVTLTRRTTTSRTPSTWASPRAWSAA